jgi:DNA-binding transcriptional ArsR family regulator
MIAERDGDARPGAGGIAERDGAARPVTAGDDAGMIVEAATVLQAMAYEHRLRILVLLLDGEATPDELSRRMRLDTTIVGHHLRNLRDSSLIHRQRRGRHVYYRLSGEPAHRLIREVLRYTHRQI